MPYLSRRTLLSAAALAMGAAPARAHSELRSSFPANGARLSTSPGRLELAFNEAVQITALRLLREQGGEIAVPRPRATEQVRRHETPLPAMETGAWRLEWRIISADGHPVGGTIRFSIGQP